MIGISYNTALVLAGVALLGGAAGVIGCFAVLRRRGLLGDALAHACLPGICLAFLLAGERNFHVLLLGAFLSGLVGIGVLTALKSHTRLKEDAAIAIVLSVFYALGVVLLTAISHGPGGVNRAGLESFLLGQAASMQFADLRLIIGLTLGTLLLVVLLYKEFKLVAFDPAFARVQGWPALALDLALQLMLVLAVVVGLPAVGVLLMAALLVIPAAAARFWTDRLGYLLFLSGGFGMLAGMMGTYPSARGENLATGPLVILAAALLFLISLALGSSRGLVRRWLRQRGYQNQVQKQQLLDALFRFPQAPVPESALRERLHWPARRLAYWLRHGQKEGVLVRGVGTVQLTPIGRDRAVDYQARKEHWQALLLRHPQEVPALLRLDLPPPDPGLGTEVDSPSLNGRGQP